MGAGELIVRILAELKSLLPGVITVVIATPLAMLYLYLAGKNAWLQSKRFALTGLFFGLSKRGIIGLACAWIKLIFPIVYIVSFQQLTVIQYLMVIVPGVILAFCADGVAQALGGLVNLALEMIGIVSTSLICGYMAETKTSTGFVLVYIAIGIFLILFGVYQFLQDLERISSGRRIDATKTWRATEDETK